MTSAYQKFKETVGDDIIDALPGLPNILVLGTISTGKSSLVANITGYDVFPTARGFATKAPIEFNFSKSAQSNNVDDIKKQITSQMNNMQTISKKAIQVDVPCSNTTPELSFIDTPGIEEYPDDHKKASHGIIEAYLKYYPLIVCVVPATISSLDADQALGKCIAKNLQSQTIVVLTMIDKEDDYQSHIDEAYRQGFKHVLCVSNKTKYGTNTVLSTLNTYFEEFIYNQWVPVCIQWMINERRTYEHKEAQLGPDPKTLSSSAIKSSILSNLYHGSSFSYLNFKNIIHELINTTSNTNCIDGAMQTTAYVKYLKRKTLENCHTIDYEAKVYQYIYQGLAFNTKDDPMNVQRFDEVIQSFFDIIPKQIAHECSYMLKSHIDAMEIRSVGAFTSEEVDAQIRKAFSWLHDYYIQRAVCDLNTSIAYSTKFETYKETCEDERKSIQNEIKHIDNICNTLRKI